MLANIRIVLVETSHPGNIGATARAMKTMGLAQLVLVRPEIFPNAEATARASGAADLLSQARVCASLPEALAGCSTVFAVTARSRTLAWPTVEPREAAALAAKAAPAGEVAFVFGRERTGLTNEEIGLARHCLTIPTNPEYGSLNLAAAVQVVAYELRMASGQGVLPEALQDPLATADEVERLYGHLENALIDLGFLDPANPRQLMQRLRRLFNRAGLQQQEVNILRGILTAAQAGARRPPRPSKPG